MSENTKKNLQEAGLKSTLPRLKIMEILENGRHLSAEEIYRDLIRRQVQSYLLII